MDGWLRAARALAWAALIGVTGVLVHAEVVPHDLPDDVLVFKDVIYRRVGARRAKLDVYLPATGRPPLTGRPALVAIHGGGWRGGTKSGYGREIAGLTKHGFAVIAVDYVLSRPGYPTWPDNLDDVREAVRWVRRNAADYAIDPARIAAIGSSAGGHLASLLGMNAGGIDPEARVSAVVDLYGPTDLAGLYKSPGAVLPLKLYLGKSPVDAPDLYAAASPIAHASGSAAPTLIIHGERDDLVPVAQSTDLARRLKAAGVLSEVIVVPRTGHAFGLKVEGRDLTPEIVKFLDGVWSGRSRSSGSGSS
jgi:acetyl esterase/lipase